MSSRNHRIEIIIQNWYLEANFNEALASQQPGNPNLPRCLDLDIEQHQYRWQNIVKTLVHRRRRCMWSVLVERERQGVLQNVLYFLFQALPLIDEDPMDSSEHGKFLFYPYSDRTVKFDINKSANEVCSSLILLKMRICM